MSLTLKGQLCEALYAAVKPLEAVGNFILPLGWLLLLVGSVSYPFDHDFGGNILAWALACILSGGMIFMALFWMSSIDV